MENENLNIHIIDKKIEESGKIIKSELSIFSNDAYIKDYKDLEILLQTNLKNFSNIYLDIQYIPEDFNKILNDLKDYVDYFYFNNIENDVIIDILSNNSFNEKSEFKTKYNYFDYVKKDKIIDTLNYVRKVKEYISHFNLSPLEIAMFVYDLTRERKFKKTNNNYDISKSRSLSEVYDNDEIVCVGYSKIYSAILNELGILTDTITYTPQNKDNNIGHMANIIFINDNKYNISGIYEVDATWRSKDDKKYNYLEYYDTFMIPPKIAFRDKEIEKLECYDAPMIIKSLKRTINFKNLEAPTILRSEEYRILLKHAIEILEEMNQDSKVVECKQLREQLTKSIFLSEEEFNKLSKKIDDILFKEIETEKFTEALYQVRRIEHSIDYKKYPLNSDLMQKIIDNTHKEQITNKIMQSLFGDSEEFVNIQKKIKKTEYEKNVKKNPYIDNIDNEDKIDVDIKRMELISLLRKAANDEKIENPVLPRKKR